MAINICLIIKAKKSPAKTLNIQWFNWLKIVLTFKNLEPEIAQPHSIMNVKKDLNRICVQYYIVCLFLQKYSTIFLLLFLFSWRVAALSWSIKRVCIHTQGASLHADFADGRNKVRGPSVREVGVISLPPQFYIEDINWSLSQEVQSSLARKYTSSCSIYRSRIIATVELSI